MPVVRNVYGKNSFMIYVAIHTCIQNPVDLAIKLIIYVTNISTYAGI